MGFTNRLALPNNNNIKARPPNIAFEVSSRYQEWPWRKCQAPASKSKISEIAIYFRWWPGWDEREVGVRSGRWGWTKWNGRTNGEKAMKIQH